MNFIFMLYINTQKFVCLCLLLFFFQYDSYTQNNLAIGQWKSFLPNVAGTSVTQSPDKIYYATKWSILSIDKEENSINFIDKINKLNDVGIRFIRYNPNTETLFIAYNNSNIDILHDNHTLNINAIKRKIELQGDKNIYDVYFENENAFLACGFGIVKLNTLTGLVDFTTFTNTRINAITRFNDNYYAATPEGIYAVPTTGANLQDFGQWQLLDHIFGFPNDYSSNALITHNNALYLDINDTLFIQKNNNLEKILFEPEYQIQFLSSGNQKIFIGLKCKNSCKGKTLIIEDDGVIIPVGERCVDRPLYAIEDSENTIWYADEFNNIRSQKSTSEDCEWRSFESIPYHIAKDVSIKNDEIWVATGDVTQNWSYTFNRLGSASLKNLDWNTYNQFTIPQLSETFDHVAIEHHPSNNFVYIGAYLGGLIAFDGSQFTVYNQNNSILDTPDLDPNSCRVSCLAFDQNKNLWIGNFGAENPIAVLKDDGSWKNFSAAIKTPTNIVIDLDGNKWFTTLENGLIVFNEGTDFNGSHDDQYRHITTNNSELPTNAVNSIAVDLDGDVWVGTSQGVVVFECGGAAFDPTLCIGNRRIVTRDDGNDEYILASENITAIAIDGANRKWFGTTNGIFVQSANGLENIVAFNEDNSPLFDNIITSLSFSEETGELFIGTERGLQSYQPDATFGGTIHRSEVIAYPNPVRPEYQGSIAIKGLPRDANVKITDINGILIYETTALGGQAIWYGEDYNGRKAQSGVYLVFTTSDSTFEEPDALVTKILFMN